MDNVILDVLIGILIWRIFSSLEPVDYNKIRNIINEEINKKEVKKPNCNKLQR